MYDIPYRGGAPADSSPVADLSEKARRSLLIMARLTAEYADEVASSCMIGDRACSTALRELEKRGHVEYR